MDYEEKYNEALERARALWLEAIKKGYVDDYLKDYETIFPELRESEDERARKAALEGIEYLERKLGWDAIGDTDILDVKEYLEKQKEQKPTPDWMPKFLDELRSKKNYFDWDEHRDLEGNILAIIDWIAPNYFNGKEQDQKPAEKQDYSGLNDSERAIHRGFLAAGVENVPVRIIKETAKDCIAHFPWPTKWSKEDERIRQGLIEMYKNERLVPVPIGVHSKDIIRFLENLRPQSKAEWSEEDEAYRKSIISTIEMCMKDCERANVVLGCYESGIAWLKRLRPSWKPSDEQMNVLRLEIGYLESRPGEHNIAVEMLRDLYNDLKKL